MKTFSMIFNKIDDIEDFIYKNKINTYTNVLVQIFSGVMDKNLNLNISKFIYSKLPQSKIIGASTDGEIANGEVQTNSIVISFSCFLKTKIESVLLKRGNYTDFELGKKIANKLKRDNSKVFILFSDGIHTNGENFVRGVNSVTNVIIAGGLAGDDAVFNETFIFNEKEIITKGAVGVSLNSDDLIVNNGFGFNWQGIGKIMTITKAKDNIVYEIDGKKSVDVYRYYFGDEIADSLPAVGIEFPLILTKEIEIARAVIGKNDDGSLVFAGNLKVGDKVRFGFGNIEKILSKSNNLIKSCANKSIESIFIYSCMARRRFLGEKVKYEIEPFSKIGDVNGFFTYGEFFQYNQAELFNQTMTVLGLSETKQKKSGSVNINLKLDDTVKTLNALSHLINVTNKELKDINDTLEEKVKEQTKKIEAKNLELEYMFFNDTLTKIPNKNALERDLRKLKSYGALLIDIKDFAALNNMYGEIVGDEVLKKFVKILHRHIGDKQKIYRVGADQFMILDFDHKIALSDMACEILDYLHNNAVKIEINDMCMKIEIFIRIALVKEIENYLFKIKADMALNYAKKKGINFVEYSNKLGLEESISNEIEAVAKVRKALKEDRIVPVFQKIMKPTGDSFECLVRIKENNKLIPPYFFLNAIRNTKSYYDITKTMIMKSFEFFKNRKESFSINFSYKDVQRDEIVEFLIEMIEKYNMYNRVIIELLESENMTDLKCISDFINKVRKYGVKVAIDDFGTGYSNFIYLTKINPDFIKIDGSLIKNIDKDKNSLLMVQNITKFAKDLECQVIAEFVHSKEIYNILKDLNIDGLQGNYLAKPQEIV